MGPEFGPGFLGKIWQWVRGCNPMDCSMLGFPVHHQFLELAQTQVSDANQPSHPLLSPSPPAFNLSQHQSLFQCVSFSHILRIKHIFFKMCI